MYLARVIGTVVASQKAEHMQGLKLLVVEPVDKHGAAQGEVHVAVDAAQAGEGDLVTCVGSREAALAVQPSFVPVDAAIIGIVDAADFTDGAQLPHAPSPPPSLPPSLPPSPPPSPPPEGATRMDVEKKPAAATRSKRGR